MGARILFLESNPQSTIPIDLAEELRELEQLLPATNFRDQIELRVAHAVRPADVIARLRNEKPNVVHFSGHGAAEGIIFRREGDSEVPIGGEALANVLKNRGIQLVVLNACYSASLGDELAKVVPAFIGTSEAVGDKAAIDFSRSFYRSLGDGSTIAEAFRDGADAVVLDRREDVFVAHGDLDQRFCGPSEGTAVKQPLAGRGRRVLRFVLAALTIDIALTWFTRWAAPFTSFTFTFLQLCGLFIPLALVAALMSSRLYSEESLKRLKMAGNRVVHRWRWGRSSVIFIMLFGTLSGPTWGAQPGLGKQQLRQGEAPGRALSPARIAYQHAVRKVNDLRQLLSLLDEQESADSEAAAEALALEEEIANSRAEVTKASGLVGSTSQCFQTRSLAIEQSAHVIEDFRQAARDSLNRAAELSHTQSLDAVVPSSETEDAFQRRFELKRDLIARVAKMPAQMQECSSLLSSTDWAVGDLAMAFAQAHQRTRDLLSRADLVRRIAQLIVDRAIEIKSRGWLNADVDTSAFPETPALRPLAQRVDILDGIAELNLRDPHTDAASRLQEYQDAVLRLVVEDDARQFLASLAETGAGNCEYSECLYLQREAEYQRETVLSTWEDAEARRLEVERTIQINPGLGIFGSPTASWADAQSAIEEAFDLARIEVATSVAFANRLQASLRNPVATALDKAIAERRAAYEQVFGFPELPEPPPPPPSPPPPPPSPPPPAPPPPPGPPTILRHAFEVLTLRAQESEGYGAYTYVIFRERYGAPPEYQALLSAIVALTPAASPDTPRAVTSTTNLFVIPGKSAEPIDSDEQPAYAAKIENYDRERALSLVQTACAGVLSTPKVLERFRQSPGPFLLTLPVPIEQAKGVTQLLLADLNGYPAAGFKDLVKSYQNDLVSAFPTNQAIWHPPWQQRVALGLISIGAAVGGQYFVALVQ